jgi:hypothetical protein
VIDYLQSVSTKRARIARQEIAGRAHPEMVGCVRPSANGRGGLPTGVDGGIQVTHTEFNWGKQNKKEIPGSGEWA